MTLAEKVERLARMVPGIGGYQDKESARNSDKSIRMCVAARLEALKRDLEADKRQLMETDDLSLLPPLDRVSCQLDKLVNTVKYASRGYRGVFDDNKVDYKRLDELCSFDLRLMDEMETLQTYAERVRNSHGDQAGQKDAIQDFSLALDGFEKAFSARQEVIPAR